MGGREFVAQQYTCQIHDSPARPGWCYVEFLPRSPAGGSPALAEALPDGHGGWLVRWVVRPAADQAPLRPAMEQEARRLAGQHRRAAGEAPAGPVSATLLRAQLLAVLTEAESVLAAVHFVVTAQAHNLGNPLLDNLLTTAGTVLSRLRALQELLPGEAGPDPSPGGRGGDLIRPELTAERILAWADAHKARTGEWPSAHAGIVAEALGEQWNALDMALRQGLRGLPGGDTLARLLRRERGLPERRGKRPSEVTRARRQQAVQLRAQGLTLREIGRRLGVTGQAVGNMLRRAEREG
jgi:hypothetical protein